MIDTCKLSMLFVHMLKENITSSSRPWKKSMSTDKQQKQEYDMDENPVYAICGKSQSKHTQSSTVSHEYEIVVPSTKERRSTSTL